MSYGVNTTIVPFKKPCVFESQTMDIPDDPIIYTLTDAEEIICTVTVRDNVHQEYFQTANSDKEINVNGWKYVGIDKADWLFTKQSVIGTVWTKGENTIYLVNESKFYGEQCYDMAVISDKKESIEAFMADFSKQLNNSFLIEGPAIAHSWY